MGTNETAEMLREAATELLRVRPDLSCQLTALAATLTLLPQIFGPDQGTTALSPALPLPPLALVPPLDGEGTGPKASTEEAR
jgi:hypothetical protein